MQTVTAHELWEHVPPIFDPLSVSVRSSHQESQERDGLTAKGTTVWVRKGRQNGISRNEERIKPYRAQWQNHPNHHKGIRVEGDTQVTSD